MRFKTIGTVLLGLLLLSACTVKKETLKKELPDTPQQEEAFRLPDVPPLQEEDEGVGKRPQHLQPVLLETKDNEKFILLNFENADIQTVIATFGELLDINYILTPGISGSVTIQSYNKFPVNNLFQIFQSILEINGLTAVKEGDFYKIIPIDMARQQPIDVDKGREMDMTLDPTFVTQLIPLEQVKASDISNILRTLMPRGTDIIVYEPSNMLIVTALPQTLGKFMKIIEAIDVSDTESESTRTFVYNVEHGEAKKLEEILKSIYGDGGTSPSGTTVAATPAQTARIRRTTTAVPGAQSGGSLPAQLGDISITAYEDINALIIKSSTRDYLALLEILKRIDIAPKQVLIEVLIAEVTLGDSLQFGLEWMLKTGRGDVFGLNLGSYASDGSQIPPSLPNLPSGLAGVVSGSRGDDLYSYVFSTLASETEVNVLASPLVLAIDNKEAEIKIGAEIPTATSTTQSAESTSTSSQIQYKTVGTILTVTPHITEKGNVNMKIVIESSDVGIETTIGTGQYPSFVTRRATTSVVVKDGHTLFLGGLIQEKKTKSQTGIPFLSRIPIIGILFGAHNRSDSKSELLVMVTPHVVADQDDADRLNRDFQNRVKTIRENLKYMRDKAIKRPDLEEDDNSEDTEAPSEEEETSPEE